MFRPIRMQRFLTLVIAVVFLSLASMAMADTPVGSTRIAQWKDDNKAVFLLMFDDSWPSHVEVAVPALVKRNMIATFYINPGKGEYSAIRGCWQNDVWKTGMVYGNHTMSHGGVKGLENARAEIGGCTKAIMDIVPGKNPRLLSWAQPGVDPANWVITPADLKTVLDENHLIDRPPFQDHGAVYHWQTTAQMLALADKAIKSQGMEYLVIHGVERRPPLQTTYQDFWALNQDTFYAVLDGLKERRDRGDLWITDHISYHEYLTERSSAKVQVLQADKSGIKLKLTCQADPAWYDQPLTLMTKVPADWRQCQISQEKNTIKATASNGELRFDALPNGETIAITSVTTR